MTEITRDLDQGRSSWNGLFPLLAIIALRGEIVTP